MENEKLLQPFEAAKLLNVTVRTLFNWEASGKIKCIRTNGNHRRYILSSFPNFEEFEEKENLKQAAKRKVCYCRVSSAPQKEDLERQVEFFKREYPDHEIIRDIGSGLNFKRKGFKSLLESAIDGDIKEIVVTHKDRLCRFGFELFETVLEKSNGRIVVLNHEKTSPEKELVDDLISIVTVFSSRLYGLRSHSIKNKIKQAADEIEPTEKETEFSTIENHEV